jgi:hypothetical protein
MAEVFDTQELGKLLALVGKDTWYDAMTNNEKARDVKDLASKEVSVPYPEKGEKVRDVRDLAMKDVERQRVFAYLCAAPALTAEEREKARDAKDLEYKRADETITAFWCGKFIGRSYILCARDLSYHPKEGEDEPEGAGVRGGGGG